MRASTAPTVSASGAAPGAPSAPKAAPAAAFVPCGGDDERPQPGRTGHRARLGAVHEGGEGLDHGREGDRGPVQDDSVPVRVDRALEPGEQEIAASENGIAAVRRLLPAEHADGKHPRARGHAG